MQRAAFLDRDGVINEDRDDYVKNLSELRVFPYAPDAIRRLTDAGFEVIVVSNQQGVAKGLVSPENLLAIQNEIARLVTQAGGRISGFYYCTHLAGEDCSCRKPKPGLIRRAAEEHGIDLQSSFMIGDSEKDIAAGAEAGCRTVLVLTSLDAQQAASMRSRPVMIARDLAEAADRVISFDPSRH